MKFLAWCTAWSFYGIGHFISHVFLRFDSLSMILYPIYNKLMIASSDISDKYGLDVWMSRQERLNRIVDELQEMMEEDDELTIPFIVEMLLKDHDVVYVAMVAKQLQQQLWDQVNLGLEVGKHVEGAIGNRTPGTIYMNPRNGVIPETPLVEITTEYDSNGNVVKEDFETVLSVSPDDPVTFKIGRAYRHSGGREIFIVGRGETTVHGNALIAEESTGRLYPVGEDKEAAVNWKMIPLSEWMRNFS